MRGRYLILAKPDDFMSLCPSFVVLGYRGLCVQSLFETCVSDAAFLKESRGCNELHPDGRSRSEFNKGCAWARRNLF